VNWSPEETALSRVPVMTRTSTTLWPAHWGGTVTLQLDAAPVSGAHELTLALMPPKRISAGSLSGGRVRLEPLITTWEPVVSAAGVTEVTTGAGAAVEGWTRTKATAARAAAGIAARR